MDRDLTRPRKKDAITKMWAHLVVGRASGCRRPWRRACSRPTQAAPQTSEYVTTRATRAVASQDVTQPVTGSMLYKQPSSALRDGRHRPSHSSPLTKSSHPEKDTSYGTTGRANRLRQRADKHVGAWPRGSALPAAYPALHSPPPTAAHPHFPSASKQDSKIATKISSERISLR